MKRELITAPELARKIADFKAVNTPGSIATQQVGGMVNLYKGFELIGQYKLEGFYNERGDRL